MIHFYWPWIFLIIPLPYFLRVFLPESVQTKQTALKVPFLEDFLTEEQQVTIKSNSKLLLGLAIIAWVFLIVATARPQWLGEPIEQTVSGRDLMLAVDLSGSMNEKDFIINNKSVNRLLATKAVATKFIRRRIGDRIGLILFGTHAYLQSPLTFDRETVVKLLNESFIGITDDRPATSIGDAIGLAIKRLSKEKVNSRVLILLTDGANTAGAISPLKAAELAKERQLKIYTIGVGADEMVIRNFFGSRTVNPSKDLDEKTLKTIAQMTGGRYFRARDINELNEIYKILDTFEPIEKEKQYFRPTKELYFYPLMASLLFATIIFLMRFFYTNHHN
ncbi:MAG: VWA domain-containing protein [Methylococcales bacterium]|nr:VWA domain-containing protein [Methylococcales bacterium]